MLSHELTLFCDIAIILEKKEMTGKHLIWKFKKMLSHNYFSTISTKAQVSFLETIFTLGPPLRRSLAWDGLGRMQRSR